MKISHFVSVVLFLLPSMFGYSQARPEAEFRGIDQNVVSIEAYAGARILCIVIPTAINDSIHKEVCDFSVKFKDSAVVVIGFLEEDSSLSDEDKRKFQEVYRESGVVLIEPMKLKKADGEEQVPFFRWLTTKAENKSYDIDAKTGTKFFLASTGRLYAVFGPNISLSHPLFDRIISSGR